MFLAFFSLKLKTLFVVVFVCLFLCGGFWGVLVVGGVFFLGGDVVGFFLLCFLCVLF